MDGKKYAWYPYCNALLPTTPPHDLVKTEELREKEIWNLSGGGYLLFARWTTDFDCGYETTWWYCIKDDLFSTDSLKAKRRYEITKGKKYFEVRRILPEKYSDELFEVTKKAFEAYPDGKRPVVEYGHFIAGLPSWSDKMVYGGFEKESGKLCGYAYLSVYPSYAEFSVLKTIPFFEKQGINAAIVAKICEDFNGRFGTGYYISDGARSVIHETAFQDYLEKYFGFRKAYCKLHILFRPWVRPWIKVLEVLWPFVSRLPRKGLWEKVAVVMEMNQMSKRDKRKQQK